MLLIHAAGRVHVSVHLPKIIEITVRDRLLCGQFAYLVQQHVQLKLIAQVGQAPVAERLHRTVGDHGHHCDDILNVLLDRREHVVELNIVVEILLTLVDVENAFDAFEAIVWRVRDERNVPWLRRSRYVLVVGVLCGGGERRTDGLSKTDLQTRASQRGNSKGHERVCSKLECHYIEQSSERATELAVGKALDIEPRRRAKRVVRAGGRLGVLVVSGESSTLNSIIFGTLLLSN